MKAKQLIPAITVLAILVIGCGKPKADADPAITADDPEKAEMTQMLESMSPEERARYVQENPEAVKSAYSGVKEENR